MLKELDKYIIREDFELGLNFVLSNFDCNKKKLKVIDYYKEIKKQRRSEILNSLK